MQPEVFKFVRCGDIIGCVQIPERTRKLILDFYALHGTAYLIMIQLQSKSDMLLNYSQVFLLSFVTRALYEKLMLLMACIDPGLDYAKLEGGKSMKRKFVEQSKRGNLDLTKKLSEHLEDLELLDDYYRSPEVHKIGRLMGLVYNGYQISLLNEVCSFFNTANHFFIDICKFLRQQQGLQ
jgi:hypothetical protein